MSNHGIEMSLKQIAGFAWQKRLDPRVYQFALKLTEPETGRAEKMRVLVTDLTYLQNLALDDGRPAPAVKSW